MSTVILCRRITSMPFTTILILSAMMILLFGGCALLIACIYELWFHNHPHRIGYIPSQLSIIEPHLEKILSKHIGSHEKKYTFYELGCGTGHVLRYISKHHNFKKNFGLELDLIWYNVCKVLSSSQPVTVIRNDVTKHRYNHPAFFYAYLKPEILKKVYDSQGFQNSLVVLLTFSIPGVEPLETINITGSQRYLHLYDFRSEKC